MSCFGLTVNDEAQDDYFVCRLMWLDEIFGLGDQMEAFEKIIRQK